MEKQPTAQLIFPNREDVTTGQLQNAISVCSLAVTALINPWRGFSGGEDDPKNSEARIALENTLIKACDRLDKILADDRRWSIEYQMALEAEFKKSHAMNFAFLESQQKAADEVASPHFQHRPKLAKSQDEQIWIAVLGDEKDLNNAVVGMGRTPEEALQEFDKNFQGKETSPEVIAFLKKRIEDQKNYGQEHQVEQTGSGNVNCASGGKYAGEEDIRDSEPSRGIHPGTDATFGPSRPELSQDNGVPASWPSACGGSQAPRKTGFRKITAFLSRFFRLDKGRFGR
jgi:hypothetical protein